MYAYIQIHIYTYIYIYIYIGDWGVDPNREIGFGFVSCSCRACVRACVRAKLCGCVREVFLNAGGPNGKKCDSGGGLYVGAFG